MAIKSTKAARAVKTLEREAQQLEKRAHELLDEAAEIRKLIDGARVEKRPPGRPRTKARA